MAFASIYQCTTIYLAGFLGGFSSSSPLGPINFLVVQFTLLGQTSRLPPFLGGVILVDVTFGLLALLGVSTLELPKPIELAIGIGGGIFLVGLGIVYLRSSLTKGDSQESPFIKQDQQSRVRDFLTGVLLCGANPGFLLFWIFVISAVQSRISFDISVVTASCFAGGIILGDGLWFWLIHRATRATKNWLSESGLKWLRITVGSLILGSGLFAIVNMTMLTL